MSFLYPDLRKYCSTAARIWSFIVMSSSIPRSFKALCSSKGITTVTRFNRPHEWFPIAYVMILMVRLKRQFGDIPSGYANLYRMLYSFTVLQVASFTGGFLLECACIYWLSSILGVQAKTTKLRLLHVFLYIFLFLLRTLRIYLSYFLKTVYRKQRS